MALNKVIMNGRLCADPELKTTQSELEHLAELCVLRKHIFEIMAKKEETT